MNLKKEQDNPTSGSGILEISASFGWWGSSWFYYWVVSVKSQFLLL